MLCLLFLRLIHSLEAWSSHSPEPILCCLKRQSFAIQQCITSCVLRMWGEMNPFPPFKRSSISMKNLLLPKLLNWSHKFRHYSTLVSFLFTVPCLQGFLGVNQGIKTKKKSLLINCLAVLLGKKGKKLNKKLDTILSFYRHYLKNCQFTYFLISR